MVYMMYSIFKKVYEALIEWVKHDESSRIAHLYDLLKLIRLPLIMPIYLVEGNRRKNKKHLSHIKIIFLSLSSRYSPIV